MRCKGVRENRMMLTRRAGMRPGLLGLKNMMGMRSSGVRLVMRLSGGIALQMHTCWCHQDKPLMHAAKGLTTYAVAVLKPSAKVASRQLQEPDLLSSCISSSSAAGDSSAAAPSSSCATGALAEAGSPRCATAMVQRAPPITRSVSLCQQSEHCLPAGWARP